MMYRFLVLLFGAWPLLQVGLLAQAMVLASSGNILRGFVVILDGLQFSGQLQALGKGFFLSLQNLVS
jgi:hypothetical protein